ncbi:MAG: DUF11 domain-containing protein [Pseudomonadales bacterium]|nr:DUF11 domain-containing protein [Pseudomonadales bacterium]
MDLLCDAGGGTIGADQDIRATFPVYIVDTLDENSCSTQGAINTAKHVTIRKSASGGGFPGSTITYTIDFQVSQFVAGIDRLELTDVLPDGLSFVNTPTVTYGGGPVAISPTITNDSPSTGQTTVVYDVVAVTGNLTPASSGSITYTATIDQTYDGVLAGEPVRARDALTNNVVGEYDIVTGASNCTDDSQETITIPDVTSSKAIIGSATAQPGETVTWRLRLEIPSGDVQGIQFNDFFPLPIFDVDDGVIGIDTTLPLSSNSSISLTAGDTVGVDPTAITVDGPENRLTIDWPDLSSASSQVIEVDVVMTVSDEPFADGLVLSNVLQAITDNSVVDGGSGLNIANLTLQQPSLSVAKTATSADAGLEAGDSVSFNIVVTNDGSAEAYDVVVTDTLPTDLTSCSLGAVVGGSGSGDLFAAGYTFSSFTGTTPTALDPGDSVTLPISCDLAATAENNASIDNTAGATWAGQPGATAFPIVENSASISTRQTESYKEIVATSEAHTSEATVDSSGDPRPVVTGEITRYRMWGYLPQGVVNGAQLTDLLPDGFEYVAGAQTLVGLVSDSGSDLSATGLTCSSGTPDRVGNESTDFSTLGLDCVIAPSSGGSGSGSDPVFSLGDVTNSEDDANEELVVLEINARVVGDQVAGTQFDNRFRIVSDNGISTSPRVYAEQLEPDVQVTKTVTPNMADANDTVGYSVLFEHSTSTGDEVAAYDVTFNDVIQPGLTYVLASVTGPAPPAVPGTDTCTISSLTVDDADPAGAGITITFDELAPGDVCEVRYQASTDGSVLPGQVITNTVDMDYSSLPGSGTAINPTGSAPGAEGSYNSQGQSSLTIDALSIVKTIVSTSLTHTPEGSADSSLDPRLVTIGETLTYRLQMRVPEGSAPDFEVTDFLPPGLEYVAGTGRVAFVFDGAGSITASPAIACGGGTANQTGDESTISGITPSCILAPSGGPFGSGTDPVWDLGDLTNTDMDADEEFVVIEFDAIVLNEVGNQAGVSLENSFELSVNATGQTSTSVFAEVAEPQLTISAVAAPNPTDNRVDTTPNVSWDITLGNSGTSTAMQIGSDSGGGWQLVLPVGLETMTGLSLTLTGNVFLNGTTTPVSLGDITLSTTNNPNDTITFTTLLQIDASASLLIEFDTELLSSILPGAALAGIDEAVYASSDTGSAGTGIRDDSDIASGSGNAPITSTANLNDYRTEVSLALATIAENPTLDVTKTISAGPANNGDGTYTLTYTLGLANSGDVGLEDIAVQDDFDTTFGAGNYTLDDVRVTSDSGTLTEDVSFTGAPATIDLLDASSSTLGVGENGSIEIDVTVTPALVLGPYTNTANVTSESDRSTVAANDSDAVDVTFAEAPEIGLAKSVPTAPVNNADGTYTFSYLFTLENSGDTLLDDLQITDDLTATFGVTGFTVDSIASTDFVVDVGYDGLPGGTPTLLAAGNILTAGSTGTVQIDVTVTPGANLGPYANSATTSGDTPSDVTANDTSDNGVVPDDNGNGDPTDDSDPTPVSFAEVPEIGLAKTVVTNLNNGDGTYTLTYRLLVENTGDIDLTNLQVTEDFTAVFAAATGYTVDAITSPDFTVVFPYSGLNLLAGTDPLLFGGSGTIDVTVTVAAGATLGPYSNGALTSAQSPGAVTVNDTSDDGTDVDENGDGDPTNDSDPTIVTFVESPVLGISKAVQSVPTSNGDGTYDLTYVVNLTNTGDVDIESVQVTDDIATAFSGAVSFQVLGVTSVGLTASGSFTGIAPNQGLLSGSDTLTRGSTTAVELELRIDPGVNLGPYYNTASAAGNTPSGVGVADDSIDGLVPDANGNSDPTDDAGVTPVTFTENAHVGIAKSAPLATANLDGTFTTTVALVVENLGDVDVSNILITDDVVTQISPAILESVANLAITGDLTAINPGFDGVADVELTDASETLAVGGSATVTFDLTFRPDDNPGPFSNVAQVTGESPANLTPGTPNVNDDSVAGADPDPDGNGDPTDNASPTPIEFPTGTDGIVDISDESAPGEDLVVTVTDPDENFAAGVVESFTVIVTNDMTGEREVITVVETGPDTGVFTATLTTTFGATAGVDDDGELNTQLDDTVTATYTDRLTSTGGVADRTDTGVVLGYASIEGNAWLDADTDDAFDAGEAPLDGWVIRVERDGQLIAEGAVAPDGSYNIPDLIPGSDYSVVLVHPDSGTTFGVIADITLAPEANLIDQNMPIDPSGVFYNSVDRTPIEGVTATLLNGGGSPLPEICLLPNQQNQVSAPDGMYRFDVVTDADPACASGDTFTIVFTSPSGFNPGLSALLPPEGDPFDPTGLGNPVRVGDSATAPTLNESTTYYVNFVLEAGDPDVVFNHIALDPVGVGGFSVRLVKDVDQRTTSIGGLVSYTLTLENLSPVLLPGISVVDSLPPGFSYVDGSAVVSDASDELVVTGTRPVRFGGLTLASGERVTLRYVLRAGVGLAHGEYINTATPYVGPAQIGNTDDARIVLVADPDFEQTTVIGKVWHDRDEDGWQDNAVATDIRVTLDVGGDVPPEKLLLRLTSLKQKSSETVFTDSAVAIERLPGRYGLSDDSQANVAVIKAIYPEVVTLSQLSLESSEGTSLTWRDGQIETKHTGKKRGGLTSQDLSVDVFQEETSRGYELRIAVTNRGLNEPGLPGVRLATVEGLLIETDAFGRYHIASVDGGFVERGRNYIVKVDRATLPKTTRFTTENPRVKRLSQGLMNRFDFGVKFDELQPPEQRLQIKIAEMFFKPGSAEVLPGYRSALAALAEKLRGGSFITLKIQSFTAPGVTDPEAKKLATRRAEALRRALCDLLGKDVSAQLETVIEPIPQQQARQELGLTDQAMETLGRLLDQGLDLLVPKAVAECDGLLCSSAVLDGAIAVDETEDPGSEDDTGARVRAHEPSVFAPSSELGDQGRVDLVGEAVTRLADGGVIWWTEDPANLEARFALEGPSHLPVRDGRFTQDQKFVVFSNYAHFHDEFVIEVFAEADVDRRKPIHQFVVDTREDKKLFYVVDWPLEGTVAAQSYVYRARIRNSDAFVDETIDQRSFAIDADLYEQQIEQARRLSIQPKSFRIAGIDDGIVVFVPGRDEIEAFEFRPQFDELGTELSVADREILDKIIQNWLDADNVKINVSGHTSSSGIAQRSQHIFADNYALSRARAQVVANYIASGLNERVLGIEASGMGPDEPIANNNTETGRALNRRAEVLIEGGRGGVAETVHTVDRLSDTLNVRSAAIALDGRQMDVESKVDRLLRRNDLERRHIPIYGSKVRFQGNNIGAGYLVLLNQERIPIDRKDKFAVEYLMPIGVHAFDVGIADPSGLLTNSSQTVEVTGKYRFLVALADLTIASQDTSGSVLPLTGDERYEEDLLTEGRLAFYLKGKIKGKYLLTAQMDTREEQLDDLFSEIHKKDPQSLFRRLDPDRYYPVYGDDSTTVSDVNSQGRMFVRLEWDRSEAGWGNFETGMTGNELGQYNRGLYGAKLNFASLRTTKFDQTKFQASGFVSESQTALGHSEFIGTGGSLYYLRHTDILPGSDKIAIEVRDPSTNRVEDRIVLAREVDYEVDDFQGRIILNKPLMQTSRQTSQQSPSLIVDGPLDGNINVLVVDYEYIPDDFDADNLIGGARAKRWFGDHLGIGTTYVNEGRQSEDYQLGGLDLTIQPKQDSWVRIEWAGTEATQTARPFSFNGGLSFVNAAAISTQDRAGDAYSVDIHVNSGDFGRSERWISNAWFKEVDDQYSVARRDDGNDVMEYGFESQFPVSKHWVFGTRASYFEMVDQYDLTELSAQIQGGLSAKGKLTSELKGVSESRVGIGTTNAVLMGLQYEHQIRPGLDLYGTGQSTLTADGGYQNNDQLALGARFALNEATEGQLEVRNGHRGNGLLAGLERRLNRSHTIYGTATQSTDNTTDPLAGPENGASMLDNMGTNFAAGHRWNLTDRANLFSEMQFSRNDEFSGTGEVFGLEYATASGWHYGVTIQDGDLTDPNGIIERQAYSVAAGYQSSQVQYATKLEWRDDQGVDDVEQWLTTNRFDFKLNETYRLAAKLNYSESEYESDNDQDAKLLEGSIGLARRPHLDDRFNWLAKYTYLHDLQSYGQLDSETDQRSHIVAWEGIYRVNRRWDVGTKVARRVGELRLSRNSGPWFESTVNFAALRARWHVLKKWDAMAEYRWLEQEEANNERGGYLVTLNRHVADNFKIGIGYNFTDFSDDLTELDYDHEGWFLNVVGKY